MTSTLRPARALWRIAAATLLTSCIALPAHAVLLDFEFVSTVATGSLDLGGGPTVLDGSAVTVSGTTVSDVDANAADTGIGAFAAATTFDFGASGVFVADAGTTFYFQVGSPALFDGIGMFFNTPGFVSGFGADIATVNSDANVAVPLGSIVPVGGSIGNAPGTLVNSQGHTLTVNILGDTNISSIQVTAAVPEPATAALLALGLAGAGVGARRRRRPRQH